MGSALGLRLRESGSRVVVALDGRSERTRGFATNTGLEDVGALTTLVGEADIVLSVVPPGDAHAVATGLAAASRSVDARPLVVDLNAVAPATASHIAETLAAAGLDLVDGAISGPPPTRPGQTRIYLSGPRAAEVSELQFSGVELSVVGATVGLASAVKMCTGSVYKGNVAILAQALRTAHAHGVVDVVLADLEATGNVDAERVGETLARGTAKAWRYLAEMDEIAATQHAAGLTPALFEAVREVYGDLAARASGEPPEAGLAAELTTVLEGLSRTTDPAG
jgi:3-hydroxyisobutyrate dehydrogenase-like beta-hydroxyacid dehydrogenase